MYNLIDQLTAFNESITKMRANFGKDNFTKEKADLIWTELNTFSPKQIRNICDVIMGENNRTPTLSHFREKASILREKIRQFDREQEAQDAKDFWAGTYHTDDVKMIVATIKDRMLGRCDDRTWKEFQDLIKAHADKTEPVKCRQCDDTGVYYPENMNATICRCSAGRIYA